MRSVHLSALTVLALGALAPSAFAAQTFSFSNPFATGGASYANSMFETTSPTSPTPGGPLLTLENFFRGTVNLRVNGGSTAGSYLATYSLLNASGGTVFTGSQNPSGSYKINEGGTLVFTSAAASAFGPAGTTLLTYTFTGNGLETNSGFGVSPARGSFVTSITGPLLDLSTGPVNNSLTRFSFGFPTSFAGPGTIQHFTADFTSSVQAVPEPTSMGVLAIGAVAMLRRRRKA